MSEKEPTMAERLECPDCDAPMAQVPCTVDGCPLPHWMCPNGCEARYREAGVR